MLYFNVDLSTGWLWSCHIHPQTLWQAIRKVCYPGARLNTLRPRQNGRRFPDDIFKYIFLNENVLISLKISLKFIPKVRINNIPALVQIMAWCRPGDKPLSEPIMGNSLTHICVTRPQWVHTVSRTNCVLRVFCVSRTRWFHQIFITMLQTISTKATNPDTLGRYRSTFPQNTKSTRL